MTLSNMPLRLAATAVCAVLLLPSLACRKENPANGGKEYKEVTVERGTFETLVTANGVVQPIDRVEIKSKASGEVMELPVEQGDTVAKGDLIARLDQKDERSNLAQAQANLDIAQAELYEAQSAFDRKDHLFQISLISEEERDQIVLNLAVGKGKLVQATTSLERAEERFAEAVVRAPIDGMILQKYVEEGQIIASGVSNVGGGTPIVDIADMKNVYIQAGIDEIDIGRITVGQAATVVAEAFPDRRFNGQIVRIAPEAKVEQNVTLFDVTVEVENLDLLLKSGMNTGIEISIAREEDVLLIPTVALQAPEVGGPGGPPGGRGQGSGEGQGERPARGPGGGSPRDGETPEKTVLVKVGNEFVPRPVTIGRSNFKMAVILSGLREGDILGIPLMSRLKEENDAREDRIRSSQGFGAGSRSSSQRGSGRP